MPIIIEALATKLNQIIHLSMKFRMKKGNLLKTIRSEQTVEILAKLGAQHIHR